MSAPLDSHATAVASALPLFERRTRIVAPIGCDGRALFLPWTNANASCAAATDPGTRKLLEQTKAEAHPHSAQPNAWPALRIPHDNLRPRRLGKLEK